jgi:hypothetical protein
MAVVVRAFALAGGLALGGLACGLGATGAAAQTDLTAGKSAAQMFSSDCSACHRSASGLSRGRDPSSVARFLRDHYTTNPNNAGALAGYLSGVGGAAPAEARGRQRPVPGQAEEGRPAQAAAQPQTQTPPRTRQPAVPPPTGAAGEPGEAAAPPPRRAGERLASAPLARLRPYVNANDPAKPAAAGESGQLARLHAYATSGVGADALRDAALAARPAGVEPPGTSAGPEAGRTPERSVAAPAVDPAADARGPAGPTGVNQGGSGTGAAARGAPAEPAAGAGPPVGSTAPTTQSNEDDR